MSDTQRFIEGTFSPENVETLSRAYRQALRMLGGDEVDDTRKAALAKHLLEIARTGEVNAATLSTLAVRRVLGQDSRASEGSRV